MSRKKQEPPPRPMTWNELRRWALAHDWGVPDQMHFTDPLGAADYIAHSLVRNRGNTQTGQAQSQSPSMVQRVVRNFDQSGQANGPGQDQGLRRS